MIQRGKIMLKAVKTFLKRLSGVNQSIKPIKFLAGVAASLVAVILGVDGDPGPADKRYTQAPFSLSR
jgi:hypothetical protein